MLNPLKHKYHLCLLHMLAPLPFFYFAFFFLNWAESQLLEPLCSQAIREHVIPYVSLPTITRGSNKFWESPQLARSSLIILCFGSVTRLLEDKAIDYPLGSGCVWPKKTKQNKTKQKKQPKVWGIQDLFTLFLSHVWSWAHSLRWWHSDSRKREKRNVKKLDKGYRCIPPLREGP